MFLCFLVPLEFFSVAVKGHHIVIQRWKEVEVDVITSSHRSLCCQIVILISSRSSLSVCSSLSSTDVGFILVIDRRQDRWAAVKGTLLRIAVSSPLCVLAYFLSALSVFCEALQPPSLAHCGEEVCRAREERCWKHPHRSLAAPTLISQPPWGGWG